MQFSLHDLMLFLAISEQQNLGRGAEKCHLSTASASVRIKNIEQSINVKLFYRTSQGVTLTPAGETFRGHAQLMLSQLERLRGDMQQYGQGIKGHLKIFASITAVAEYLPPLLGQFLAQHDDVDIDLREYPSPEVTKALLDGRIDLGIVAGNITSDALESVPFRTDKLVVVTPADHPLAASEYVTFSATTDYSHISLPESSGMAQFIQNQADKMNKKMKVRIQVGNFETFCRMIAANVGIGIMPFSAASRLRGLHRISVINLSDVWALRRLHLCARHFDALPGYARKLVKHLAQESTQPT